MYVCSNCGNESLKWSGQCSFCKEWNTLSEFKESKAKKGKLGGVKKELKKIGTTDEILAKKSPTLSKELNNLLG